MKITQNISMMVKNLFQLKFEFSHALQWVEGNVAVMHNLVNPFKIEREIKVWNLTVGSYLPLQFECFILVWASRS